MSEPKALFLTKTVTAVGEPVKLAVVQAPGDDRLVLGLELGEDAHVIGLTAAQAVGLAVQLLGANLGALGHLAHQIPHDMAAAIALGLLDVPAQAALMAATEGQRPS